jgi:transcriptional regulator with XRE-family HTH domain
MGHKAYPPPKRLAKKLLAIRRQLGLSQTQMAKRINFYTHYNRLSEYETGRRQPCVQVLLAYARAANIPMENIVDDDIELTPNR